MPKRSRKRSTSATRGPKKFYSRCHGYRGNAIEPVTGIVYSYRASKPYAKQRYYRVVRVVAPLYHLPYVILRRVTSSGKPTPEKIVHCLTFDRSASDEWTLGSGFSQTR